MTQRRAIRRHITRVIVFLVLGVIVNVAVAWSCILVATLEVFDIRSAETEDELVHGENFIRRVVELTDNGQLDYGVLNWG